MGQFDITLGSLVPLEHRIPNPHARRRIQFRARLKQGDPLAVLPAGMSQKIELTDAHTVDVTVLAVRPEWPEMLITPVKDLPTEDDRTANSLIQSDNELVMAMAKTATAGKKDDWSKAVALERYVYDNIENKNFLQTLASAAEVARTREGDCTEHAVLLAAMARAVGLPARVAVGLVYIERSQEPKHAFAYHMWTEIHVNHRWIPMDATLGLGGAGPARLKLAHGSLKDSDAMSSFLPVIKVLGRLQLEVIDFE
jgi:transglutaminase-like putative cysteine protease